MPSPLKRIEAFPGIFESSRLPSVLSPIVNRARRSVAIRESTIGVRNRVSWETHLGV